MRVDNSLQSQYNTYSNMNTRTVLYNEYVVMFMCVTLYIRWQIYFTHNFEPNF